ncbi:MAG: hypothetical protein ACRDGT_07925 [Candidatus Limnocylindria bacterium]
MSIRLFVTRLLVPLFVVALLIAPATPAEAFHGAHFTQCTNGADTDCLVSLKVGVNFEDPDNGSGLDLDVFLFFDVLQIQVIDADNNDDQDLGADFSDTEFELVIRTSDSFSPIVLIGTGVIDTWLWDDATKELTIVATPEASSFAFGPEDPSDSCNNPEPEDGRTPGQDYDLGGICEQADADFAAMLSLAAAGPSDVTELEDVGFTAGEIAMIQDFETAYTGGFVATDAQEFMFPDFNPFTQAVEFDLSAPHFTFAGAVNTGFFNVLLPEPLFTDLWAMTFDQNSPPSIGATADGSAVTLQVPEFVASRSGFPAGWLIKSNTITYSSPTISLAPGSSSSVTEPTQFDLSSGSTTPASTRLPVALPSTGEVTRQVTLQGTGATLVMPQGTMVTVGGELFTGTIEPATRVQGRPAGLRSAVSITASGGSAEADSLSATASAATLKASARSAQALGDDEVVFDPPVTITIVDTSAEAADSRVVRIAPDGSITDLAGTMTGRGVQAQITGLGTYGLATELDLARISSAPSISVALPVRLPSDGVIDFPTTLNGDSASISFASTAVTDASGEAFAGTLEAPAAATAPSGVGSVVEVATSDGTAVTFAPAATLTLTLPEGTSAREVAPVEVTSATATSCLAAIATDNVTTQEATTVEVGVAGTGTFGLAPPVTAEAALVARDWTAASGHHSQWAGQSAAPSLCAGQVAEVSVLLRNTGTTTWTAGRTAPLVLATNAPPGNMIAIDSGLVVAPLYDTRLATHEEASVAPGAVGTFSFKVKAPAEAGTHRINVRPVAEGLRWLEDEGIFLEILVR